MLELCPECGSKNLQESRLGETACANCGLVLEDNGIERTPFIAEPVKNRADNPYLVEARTKPINGKIYKDVWLLNTREKNLRQGQAEIRSLAERLKCPDVVLNESRYLFKQAVMKGLSIGRERQNIVYASVYTASLMHNYPKTVFEMIAFTQMTKKKLLRAHKLLKQELNIELKPIDPTDYVHRFSSRIGLKPTTASTAVEILEEIKGKKVMIGKNPKTMVATAIYLATKINNDPKTQREITNATGVLEVTIRKRSREIMDELNF